MTPKVAFETLGCKLNQFETDAIAAGFLALGWEVVDADQEADAYVVNTCTVTDRADRKSQRTLFRHLGDRSQAVVVATGCFAESSRDILEAQEGITFVVPNGRKNQIPSLVDAHRKGEVLAPSLPVADPFGFPVHGKVFHTRASLKIQDGCDNFCTFCIIPSVRGRGTSRPYTEVLAAARGLVAQGSKELVLTGVNMGRWNEGSKTFTDLVEGLLALDGDFRLRITSLEPEGLSERFADLFRHPKMAPHLHLCLQSGSPRILLAMRREYHLDQYASLVELLRSRNPGINLTTDMIVGFPGETDEDFDLSLGAIRRFDFSFVHVFPYSRRQDTRAERMVDQVPEATKTARSRRMQGLVRDQRLGKMESMVGEQRTVLIETSNALRASPPRVRGLTEDYFPVRIEAPLAWNSLAVVRLARVTEDGDEPVFEATLAP